MSNIEALKDLNARYVRQRDNLDRIIAENQRRIAEAETARVPRVIEGDLVDVDYRKPRSAFSLRPTDALRQFVRATVKSITPTHLHVEYDDDNGDPQYRTLKRDRIVSVRDFASQEEVALSAGSNPSNASTGVGVSNV